MEEDLRTRPTPERLMRLLDHHEICELSHRYSRAADQQDYELLSTIFTPDGALCFAQPWSDESNSRMTTYQGTQALREMPKPPLRRGLHVVANIQVAFGMGGDDAQGVVYFVRITPNAEGGFRVSNAGIYRDRYCRTRAGWAIARRDIDPLPADGLADDAFAALGPKRQVERP